MKSSAIPIVTDADLLEGLRNAEPSAYRQLYAAYFPSVAYYIKGNQGSHKDAEDVFQETLLVLVGKIRDPHFQLRATLKTYLHAIARKLWLKKLRDTKEVIVEDEFYFASLPDEVEPAETGLAAGNSLEQVPGWISQFTGNCQRILNSLYYLREPMEYLMTRMGWKNKHTADNQKYKCIQQVKKVAAKTTGAALHP